jgi:hypothetical protein
MIFQAKINTSVNKKTANSYLNVNNVNTSVNMLWR